MRVPTILIVLIPLMLVSPLPSHALEELQVSINGVVEKDTDDDKPADGQINICDNDYGARFHIVADNGGSCADSVRLHDDGRTDSVQLHNIKLVADAANVTVNIIFWGGLAAGPSGTNTEYELITKGHLLRPEANAAQGSEIWSYGYFKNPDTDPTWTWIWEEHYFVEWDRPESGDFNKIGPEPKDGVEALNNNRKLRGHVKVLLKAAGDWLELKLGSGVIVKTDDTGGGTSRALGNHKKSNPITIYE